MKKILIVIMLIATTAVFAQRTNKHGLGFAGGLISGSGFSYRYLGDKNGFQVNFAGITRSGDDSSFPDSLDYAPDEGNLTENKQHTFFNIGINYLKPIHSTDKSNFYLLAGVAVYYNSEENYQQDYSYDDIEDVFSKYGDLQEVNEVDTQVNVGGGIGIAYNLTSSIEIFVDWPIIASFEDDNIDMTMAIPQGGIHYFFK